MQRWHGKFQSKWWKFEEVRDIWNKGVIGETRFSTLPQADATSLLTQGCQTYFLWWTPANTLASHIQWSLTREVDALYSKWKLPLLRLLLADVSHAWWVLLGTGEASTGLVMQHTTYCAQAKKAQSLGAALGVCKHALSKTSCCAHPALHTCSCLAQSQGPL